jgi:hypothetical protein
MESACPPRKTEMGPIHLLGNRSRTMNQCETYLDTDRVSIPQVGNGETNVGKGAPTLWYGVRDRWYKVPCVFLVNLIPSRTELRSVVATTPRMRAVVMTDGRVAVKAEWNGIIDVGTTGIKVYNLDSGADCASTQAAMAPTPEQHTYLVLFLEVVAFLATHAPFCCSLTSHISCGRALERPLRLATVVTMPPVCCMCLF